MPFPQVLCCDHAHWELALLQLLKEHKDVDLTHFDLDADNALCESIAKRYSMEMTADLNKKLAHFRSIPPSKRP
jgi:hypothetical protein